jgi:hypothetical protein
VENNSDSSSRRVLIASAAVLFIIALGVVVFVAYQRRTSQTAVARSNQMSPAQPFTQQMISPPPPLISAPPVIAAPSPSPSPSPSPTATPTPAVKAEPARVALSTGPVATNLEAGNKRGPVVIRLTDGTTIKADEAWETAEGFWYRRSGMVTLLKRDQVKALENPAPPKASSKPSPIPAPTLSPIQSR